jgi:hypothetical protein
MSLDTRFSWKKFVKNSKLYLTADFDQKPIFENSRNTGIFRFRCPQKGYGYRHVPHGK